MSHESPFSLRAEQKERKQDLPDLNHAFGQFLDEVYNPLRGRRSSLLTGRQQEILELLARGRSMVEIAKALEVTQSSVDTSIYSSKPSKKGLFLRLGVNSREEAVLKAVTLGELDLQSAVFEEGLDLNRFPLLDNQKQDILFSLIKSGGKERSNMVISQELSVTEESVNVQSPAIYRELGVRSRPQAALFGNAVLLSASFLQG